MSRLKIDRSKEITQKAFIIALLVVVGVSLGIQKIYIGKKLSQETISSVSPKKEGIKSFYTEDTRYYDISGSSVTELREQMGSLGPEDFDGVHYYAQANWYVNWVYEARKDNASCITGPLELETSVNYVYPNWINKENASVSLQTKWDDYMIKLQGHEALHKETAVQCGKEERAFFESLPHFSDCETLDAYIHDKANRILEHCRVHDEEIDERTNHGANDGVVF